MNTGLQEHKSAEKKSRVYFILKIQLMKFLPCILVFFLLPFVSAGQCPVINTAMINACAQAPSTAEGINEFVYFTTTSAATAGDYTLSYGVNNPPASGLPVNKLSGSNATTQNGSGTLTTTNGCTIIFVTSPATPIPANSGVILIPSNFDNSYDLTGICNGSLYAILVDITVVPSNTWNPGGTFGNATGASPRYLQISNNASNCASNVVTYSGNGWPGNADGNSVWWGSSGTSYQNNGCNTVKPPKPTITPSVIAAVCERSTSASMSFTTTGNPAKYSIDWDNIANAAGFADVNAAALTASPLTLTLPANAPAATYTGSLTVINSLTPDTSIAQNISVTITAAPVISVQPSTTVQNVCQNGPVATLSVTATAGSGSITGYQWYITTNNNNTSGAAIPFATSSTYTPSSANLGTIYFYCKITNSNGCSTTSGVSGALIVSPNITTPSASATQQPTCALPTGTIVVTAPVGLNIEYSDGGAYQASGTFANLAPGITYNITAKNVVTGCVSPVKTVPIDALPLAPAVSATVTTQPTCTVPTGTITISSPTGADYEYSVGGAYQNGLVFPGLINSTTYNVTVRQISTGCTSAILPLMIDPIAGAPARPDITVVHPDCNTATGTINVTAPLNANYEYSIGGAYQAGVSFSSLPPGTNYSVTVKDISTGCISAPHDTATNNIVPVASPIVNSPVTYCQNAVATALTATGTNLKWYSTATGNTPLPATPVPSTATAGSIKYYVSQTVSGCESPRDSITVVVNPTPALPGTAGNTTTYCENETTNVLTATGSNLQWYNVATGGTALTGAPTPSAFGAGTTTYYVSQTINGCESGRASITITVNPIPNPPTVPNANIQYCHNTAANPLTATGTNLLWYTVPSGGSGSSSSPVISTAATGSSFYYVSQTVNGCESGRNIITVTVVAVATPPVTAPVEYCLNATASPLTANGINLQWYATLTSTPALPSAPIPPTTTVGSTKYYVSQLINTCESKRDSITVTIKPASQPPQVVSPLEYCQNTVAPSLTAAGINLLWYIVNTGGTGSSTAPVPATTTPGTTFYYVTQNTNGCESTPRTAITVTVKVTSTAVAGFHFTPDTVCLNGLNPVPAYDLSFTNGGTFTSTPAGLGINSATGNINLASSNAGTYSITYTYNTTGCVIGNTASSNITLNTAIPTVVGFSYSSPVCKDAAPVMPATLAGFTTGGSFSAIPSTLGININTGVVDVSNSLPGVYTITYRIAEQGCRQARSSFSFINIIDTASPVTKFNYSSTDVCLTAGAVNPTITKAAGFTTGGTFIVSPAGLNVNNTTGDINIGLSVPGTYVIKYSVASLGCRIAGSDSLVFKLKAYSNPVTNFSYTGPVCKGDTNAIPVPDANFTQDGIFTPVTAGLVVDAASGIIDLVQSIAGNHTVKYDVAQGACNPAGSGLANIVVLAQPEAPTVTTAAVCGEGNVTLNAAALGSINWYTEPALINQINIGSDFSTFINSNTSFYVTNKVGACESEAAVAKAIVYPVPAKPYLGRDTSICPGEKLVLNAGAYNSYLWQDGSINSTYTVSNSGMYKVIVSTGIGCSDSAGINITILEDCNDIVFPNAFAPNGYNKTFGALGNLLPVSKYALHIYNRYGQEIFATADPSKKWDGTFMGKPVNIGTYVYVATYVYKNKTDRVKKGTVTVIR